MNDTPSMNGAAGRILIADDEPSVRDSVGYALAQEGFEVTAAEDGTDAEERLAGDFDFDLLILDWQLPDLSGLQLLRWSREHLDAPPPAIMLRIMSRKRSGPTV